MKRKWLALLITFAMLACTYGLAPYLLNSGERQMPQAINGVLDISKWNFRDDGVLPLDGEWEFYPNHLFYFHDFHDGKTQPSPPLLSVPGSWSNQMSTFGLATYRLILNGGEGNQVYGLKTLSIQMASRIFVNGSEIGSSGNPAEPGRYVGKNKPIVGFFTLEHGRNEIIVQVANYDFPASSGLKHSIYLGYDDQISTLHARAIAYDWITVSAFLIIGLYFIGMYTQRRKDTFLLIFGLMCIFITIYSTCRGERVIFELFPDMPAEIFLRTQLASTIGASTMLYVSVYFLFRPFCSAVLIRIALLFGVLLIVLCLLFLGLFYNDVILPIHSIYVSFAPIYMMYVLVLAALHRVEGSSYLAVAAVALNIYAFVQNLNVYLAVPVYRFPPIEPFLFLLMLSLLISLRFSNAYKQNEELSLRLIQADRLKDEFITKTAHEFKTPLHGLVHIAESIIQDTEHPLTPGQKENLNLISTVAKRLSQLVYDILDLARLREGELKVDLAPLDVHSLAEVVIRVFSFLLGDKPVQLINRVPEDLPYVLADENRVRQILSNLVDNAVKFTEEGVIEITAMERDGMIEIIVMDTGVGMDDEQLAMIFEPYQTLQADSNQSFGLGMSIVKQLVELQNGQIWIRSAKGIGTSVHFTMQSLIQEREHPAAEPLRRSEPAANDPRSEVMPAYSFQTPYISATTGTSTILVVDDHYANLKVLIDLLEPLKYTVVAVTDGQEALEKIAQHNQIDLLILDVMMPGLSGLEVCREIRQKHSVLELPILMVTASIQPEDKIAAFDAGANDFLSKPFDAAELKARVKSLLIIKEMVGKAVDLEVAFLQSQIKPHFLFNVLNTIMALSYTDAEHSRKLTTDLADYLRGSFHFGNIQKKVPLTSELALIQSYVEIEKARFKERIRVEYDIAADVKQIQLPPLLLQPLVENAIRHGIGNRIEGGIVQVRAYRAENHYVFEIEDNGVGMTEGQLRMAREPNFASPPTARSGVGLHNIRKRVKYAYGTELSIQSSYGMGTKVSLFLPVSAHQAKNLGSL